MPDANESLLERLAASEIGPEQIASELGVFVLIVVIGLAVLNGLRSLFKAAPPQSTPAGTDSSGAGDSGDVDGIGLESGARKASDSQEPPGAGAVGRGGDADRPL